VRARCLPPFAAEYLLGIRAKESREKDDETYDDDVILGCRIDLNFFARQVTIFRFDSSGSKGDILHSTI